MLPGQNFIGQGEITHKGRHLATVHYRIQVWLEPRDDNGLPHAPVVEPKGDAATGSLVVTTGDIFLPVGEMCVLRLESGHKCRVFLELQAVGSGYYRMSLLDIADLR